MALADWRGGLLEGQLADHTLWIGCICRQTYMYIHVCNLCVHGCVCAETRKLFGHTGDIMSLAISNGSHRTTASSSSGNSSSSGGGTTTTATTTPAPMAGGVSGRVMLASAAKARSASASAVLLWDLER